MSSLKDRIHELLVGLDSITHSTLFAREAPDKKPPVWLRDHLRVATIFESILNDFDPPDRPTLRPVLTAFAQDMERALRKNDYKGETSWREDTFAALFLRLREEMDELEVALRAGGTVENLENVIRESADVANFAMMVADLARIDIAQAREPKKK